MPRQSPESALLQSIRRALVAAADPRRAPAMQAYMKSTMPYHGVPMPLVRSICKELFATLPLATRAAWEREVRGLWNGSRFREERYTAIALTGVRYAHTYQTPEAMPLYEMMIVSGAWWDVVDELATNRVGPILRAHPKVLEPMMRLWSKGDDMWKRRTSIICQVRSRDKTNVELLYACIEPSIASKEFFLRKAIGWALREYAKSSPRDVAAYVKKNASRLSGLSKREALKHVAVSVSPPARLDVARR
jgi:3-methyladenine DNA glycosylase AlkD